MADKERDEIIDELYHKVWGLMDSVGNLQREILEIGEQMKDVVSSSVFESVIREGSEVKK